MCWITVVLSAPCVSFHFCEVGSYSPSFVVDFSNLRLLSLSPFSCGHSSSVFLSFTTCFQRTNNGGVDFVDCFSTPTQC